jgi:hypothetical protein
MQLMLNDEDARRLHDLIRDYLPDLRRQAAATELPSRELKSELNGRVKLCERLLGELGAGRTSAGGGGGGAVR